jgi:hypothetical protein
MRLVKFHDRPNNKPIGAINPVQITHVLPVPDREGYTAIFLTDGETLTVPFTYGDTIAKIESAMRE